MFKNGEKSGNYRKKSSFCETSAKKSRDKLLPLSKTPSFHEDEEANVEIQYTELLGEEENMFEKRSKSTNLQTDLALRKFIKLKKRGHKIDYHFIKLPEYLSSLKVSNFPSRKIKTSQHSPVLTPETTHRKLNLCPTSNSHGNSKDLMLNFNMPLDNRFFNQTFSTAHSNISAITPSQNEAHREAERETERERHTEMESELEFEEEREGEHLDSRVLKCLTTQTLREKALFTKRVEIIERMHGRSNLLNEPLTTKNQHILKLPHTHVPSTPANNSQIQNEANFFNPYEHKSYSLPFSKSNTSNINNINTMNTMNNMNQNVNCYYHAYLSGGGLLFNQNYGGNSSNVFRTRADVISHSERKPRRINTAKGIAYYSNDNTPTRKSAPTDKVTHYFQQIDLAPWNYDSELK
jgi:hypothetical protein